MSFWVFIQNILEMLRETHKLSLFEIILLSGVSISVLRSAIIVSQVTKSVL